MEKVLQQKIVKRKSEENFHKIERLSFEKDTMILKVDGRVFRVKLKDVSMKLYEAEQKEREAFKVICSGYGISWPLIDEDLSVDGIIKSSQKKQKG